MQREASTSALRYQAWQDTIDSDARGALQRLVAREGLSLDSLQERLMRTEGLHPNARWIDSLESALAAIAGHSRTDPLKACDVIAFADTFNGLVSVTRQKKQGDWVEQLSAAGIRVSTDAFNPLFDYLAKRLAHYLGPTLFAAFATERQEWPEEPEPGDTHRYLDFVQRAQSSGLYELILDRPVLGRMLVNIVDLFEESLDRFFADFCNDFDQLHTLTDTSITDVSEISCGHSDPHQGGRTVVFVRFDSGARLVYKPRGLALDRRWQDLLDWAASAGLMGAGGAAFIDCEDHGWQAWVEHAPARTCEDVRRYFERCGVALALFQIAGANDIHQENVIAVADTPFFIDLETLVAGATVK